jgi:hypothetical protein
LKDFNAQMSPLFARRTEQPPLDFEGIANDLAQRAAHVNQTIMSGEGQLLFGIAQLIRVIGANARATDRQSRLLVFLTVAFVVLTFVLILLGIVQLLVG